MVPSYIRFKICYVFKVLTNLAPKPAVISWLFCEAYLYIQLTQGKETDRSSYEIKNRVV